MQEKKEGVYSLKDENVDRTGFAIEYAENFIRWYAAFRLRESDLIDRQETSRENLPDFMKKNMEFTREHYPILDAISNIRFCKNHTMPLVPRRGQVV